MPHSSAGIDPMHKESRSQFVTPPTDSYRCMLTNLKQ